MTNGEAVARLKDLITYMESLKPITRLRVNGLISQNKTEREYYAYQEKKEWLRASKKQLNNLRQKR